MDSLEAHSPGLIHRNPPAALRLRLPRFWDKPATPILSRPCGHSTQNVLEEAGRQLWVGLAVERGGGPGRSEGPVCRASIQRRTRHLRAERPGRSEGACGRGGGDGRDLRFPGLYGCSEVTLLERLVLMVAAGALI